ncbi:MAG: TIGR04100 family radical SAM protein [Butyrivibrio sp.]
MTILYEVHDNLYVNLTNKCPCACTFCLRQTRDHMENSGVLWLEHEPSIDEVKAAFSNFDMSRYSELVFCGFGEPTERIDVLLETARFVKENYHMPIRINTNGLGNLIHGRDITPEFKDLIDTVSISLNTPNKERYYELTRSRFGVDSFDALLDFAKAASAYVPNVVLTTVATTITPEEEQECQRICDELGVRYRIRPYEE